MTMKIDRNDHQTMARVANKMFGTEEIDIKEEDFAEQFDNHIKMPGELVSQKEDLIELGSHCNRYEPCPICYKCRVKGSHIYDKCDKCSINICVHESKVIDKWIVRDNFSQELPDDVGERIERIREKVCQGMGISSSLFK